MPFLYAHECVDIFLHWKISLYEGFPENTLYNEVSSIKTYVQTPTLQWSNFSDILSFILSTDNAILLLEKQRGKNKKEKNPRAFNDDFWNPLLPCPVLPPSDNELFNENIWWQIKHVTKEDVCWGAIFFFFKANWNPKRPYYLMEFIEAEICGGRKSSLCNER